MTQEVQARVLEVISRTHDVRSVRLEVGERLPFSAGQFLAVWLKTAQEGEVRRYLSISNAPTEGPYLEFTKRLTSSAFSQALDKLKPGDTLRLQYPMGKFTLEGVSGKIAFISGGIGITPIRSICKYVVDTNRETDMVLVYANRSIDDIVFRDDFAAMQASYPKLRVAHVLCEAAPGFQCVVGLVDAQVLKNEVPDYLQRTFFLCGPPGMVEAMRTLLTGTLGVSSEKIVTENFQGY